MYSVTIYIVIIDIIITLLIINEANTVGCPSEMVFNLSEKLGELVLKLFN